MWNETAEIERPKSDTELIAELVHEFAEVIHLEGDVPPAWIVLAMLAGCGTGRSSLDLKSSRQKSSHLINTIALPPSRGTNPALLKLKYLA